MPGQEFANPPLTAPPPGLNPDEIDIGDHLMRNAQSTNEGTGKLQHLLNYLHTFRERQITDLRGYKHTILSRESGGLDASLLGGCLKPLFRISDTKQVSAFFASAFILVPGGDSRSLIPLPPKFQGVYLDDPPNSDPAQNSQPLSNGNWEAYITISGYNAEITVQTTSGTPPVLGTIGDSVVWRLATWVVEDAGTEDAKISGEEYYACPFIPSIDETAHPFFPFLYQKKKSLQDDDAGPSNWFMKVWHSNVHDVLEGDVLPVQECDGATEKEVTAGQTWWCKLETNVTGRPTVATITESEPTIQLHREDPDIPDSTEGEEQEGVYKFKLFTLEEINGKLVPRIFLGSDIIWGRNLIRNIGGGDGRVWKWFNTNNNRHELRSLTGLGDVTITTMGDEILIEVPC